MEILSMETLQLILQIVLFVPFIIVGLMASALIVLQAIYVITGKDI